MATRAIYTGTVRKPEGLRHHCDHIYREAMHYLISCMDLIGCSRCCLVTHVTDPFHFIRMPSAQPSHLCPISPSKCCPRNDKTAPPRPGSRPTAIHRGRTRRHAYPNVYHRFPDPTKERPQLPDSPFGLG